jgi:hypothetical protein
MTTTILSKIGFVKRVAVGLSEKQPLAAASVRVPVTAANREYLRALRQAELEAWRDAPGGTCCVRQKA